METLFATRKCYQVSDTEMERRPQTAPAGKTAALGTMVVGLLATRTVAAQNSGHGRWHFSMHTATWLCKSSSPLPCRQPSHLTVVMHAQVWTGLSPVAGSRGAGSHFLIGQTGQRRRTNASGCQKWLCFAPEGLSHGRQHR